MANNFDMFTKKGPSNTSENLPYAFSHIATGAPPSVYMSMMTGNTFDEAMQETNNIPFATDEMDMDLDLALDPELDDPDAIEKAIYQLRIAEEKEIEPEEVLETPYGPGLSGEEIDLLLDMYPALDAGVDLDMIDENFDEVDRMLGESGESIEAAMDAAEQRAEDEGDIGSSPALMRQLGDNLGNSLEAMLNPRNRGEELAAESFTNSPFSAPDAIKVAADNATGVFQNFNNNRSVRLDNGQVLGPSDLLGSGVDTNPDLMLSGAESPKASTAHYDFRHMLTLMEPNDDGSFLTPAVMIEELQKGMSNIDTAEYVKKFFAAIDRGEFDTTYGTGRDVDPMDRGESRPFTYGGGTLSQLKKDLEGLVGQEEREPEQTQPTESEEEKKRFIVTEDEDEDEDGFVEKALPRELADAESLLAENLQKVFYTSIYAYPEAGRSDVRPRLPNIYNDTRTLFFLEYGGDAVAVLNKLMELEKEEDIVIGDVEEAELLEKRKNVLGTMEARYKTFLSEYLTDPTSKRSGDFFRKNLALISNTLSYAANNPDREDWPEGMEERELWVDALFGTGGGTFAEENRSNLIKMAASQGGRGWYSNLIHSSVDRVMNYYDRLGWTVERIFTKMAQLTGMPVTDPTGQTDIEKLAADLETTKTRVTDDIPPPLITEIMRQQGLLGSLGDGGLGELGEEDGILDGPTQLLPGTGFDVDPVIRGDVPYVEQHPGITQAVAAAQKQRDEGDFSGLFPFEGPGSPTPDVEVDMDPMAEDWEFYADPAAIPGEVEASRARQTGDGGDAERILEMDPTRLYGLQDLDPMNPLRDEVHGYSSFSGVPVQYDYPEPGTGPGYDVLQGGGYAGAGGKLTPEEFQQAVDYRRLGMKFGGGGGALTPEQWAKIRPTGYGTRPEVNPMLRGEPDNFSAFRDANGRLPWMKLRL